METDWSVLLATSIPEPDGRRTQVDLLMYTTKGSREGLRPGMCTRVLPCRAASTGTHAHVMSEVCFGSTHPSRLPISLRAHINKPIAVIVTVALVSLFSVRVDTYDKLVNDGPQSWPDMPCTAAGEPIA